MNKIYRYIKNNYGTALNELCHNRMFNLKNFS